MDPQHFWLGSSSSERRVSLIRGIGLLLERLTLLVGHFRAGDRFTSTKTVNELLVGERQDIPRQPLFVIHSAFNGQCAF